MHAAEINYAILLSDMMEGLLSSLQIFALTLLIGLPLGLVLAGGRMSRHRVISLPVQAYLLVMRGTPLMLQLFFFMYGPYYILGYTGISRFGAVIVAFSLNYAAYFAEIYRGGLESIPVGQYEAAATLGFTKGQTFFKIILPQVVKRVIPPMGNEFMTLVKDTALARVIAFSEMFDVAQKAASGHNSVIPFIVAGAFYLAMNAIVGQCFVAAEKKLDYYR
ncbi:amino acid ABC transporter membrane protein, PAAT family [Papillibacter cinnamivorans DSM 12816]|uniref:Amino acid ABC transporter membrane protein, PAAT family n=2 Tax=Papillibacter TaxID=100175 RepID=A0A1W2BV88_9FIRM|nr:amino acid ABC transporter membrane protein, PAAT family [Papillibacter cinnamivorans DSM 12816]